MTPRRILLLALGIIVSFGLLPASAAFARDDIVCVRERDSYETRRTADGGLEGVTIHTCLEWRWTGSGGGTPKDRPPAEDENVGGGISPDGDDPKPTCDDMKADLRKALDQLDLLNREIDKVGPEVRNLTTSTENAYRDREETRQDYIVAQGRTDAAKDAYMLANDIDPTVETTPKAGVTIVRTRATYSIDTGTLTGRVLQAAIEAEDRARADHYAADDAWRYFDDRLTSSQSYLDALQEQLRDLLQRIEQLQGQLNADCK